MLADEIALYVGLVCTSATNVLLAKRDMHGYDAMIPKQSLHFTVCWQLVYLLTRLKLTRTLFISVEIELEI